MAESSGAGSLLVLCRPFLGDIVFLRPVLDNLRSWMPGARLVVATYAEALPALSLHPQIDERLALPHRRPESLARLGREWFAFANRVRPRKFDLLCDLLHSDRSALISLFSRASRRISYAEDPSRFRYKAYDEVALLAPGESTELPILDLYLSPLLKAGIPIRSTCTRIEPAADEVRRLRLHTPSVFEERQGPVVVLHPGASRESKCWPVEEFAALADAIQERHDANVVLIGGPRETRKVAAVGSRMRRPFTSLQGELSVRELATLLSLADLFVGFDSGPMHLAAAVGTPVVAIFGASSVSQWRPVGARHEIVQPPLPCTDCPFPGVCRPPDPYQMYCARRIPPEAVLEAVRRLLEARARSLPTLPASNA